MQARLTIRFQFRMSEASTTFTLLSGNKKANNVLLLRLLLI